VFSAECLGVGVTRALDLEETSTGLELGSCDVVGLLEGLTVSAPLLVELDDDGGVLLIKKVEEIILSGEVQDIASREARVEVLNMLSDHVRVDAMGILDNTLVGNLREHVESALERSFGKFLLVYFSGAVTDIEFEERELGSHSLSCLVNNLQKDQIM
jgi:hypothetical protein